MITLMLGQLDEFCRIELALDESLGGVSDDRSDEQSEFDQRRDG